MKLSISNIAWDIKDDEEMYEYISQEGFQGLEIAPTRLFSVAPYDELEKAKEFSEMLKSNYQLVISSMQSIWYGITQRVFGSEEERQFLIDYTKKAIDFAQVLGCNNLVFGCPKNRVIDSDSQYRAGVDFFKELGAYAALKNTLIAIEPNPTIYNTNYINFTADAFALVKEVDSEAVKVNLDFGTILYNEENLNLVNDNLSDINHIHISEPNLVLIEKRDQHKMLAILLKNRYHNFISVEMGKRADLSEVKDTIQYIKEVF